MRILIIEDENLLREQLRVRLKAEGHLVDTARDGEEGLFAGREYPIDIVVIDLGLPKLSGIEVIQALRAAGRDYPILILTARGRWQDKVAGLEAGADDYLVKPFEIEELLARLRALVRRASGWTQATLQCGPIVLDTSAQSVLVDARSIELTTYEYKVLEHLMLHSGEVISKTDLTEHLYEQDFDRDSNTIEVFIGRLRRKLDPDNLLNPIETVRGRGYRLALARGQ